MDTTTEPNGRNQLAEYLAETRHTEFAQKVQCSDSHLSLILKGERGMSLALAKRISAASGIPIENLPHERSGSEPTTEAAP